MELLYGRLQVADSANYVDPWAPDEHPLLHTACSVTGPGGLCAVKTRGGARPRYEHIEPPEASPYIQRTRMSDLTDARSEGGAETIGATDTDMSKGRVPLVASDMPLVRKFCYLDTRTRDPVVTPDATNVTFMLDHPIDSVTRISLHSARVPIRLDPENPGLTSGDYIMLSIGMILPDVVAPVNKGTTANPTFTGALAYLNIEDGATYAVAEPSGYPGDWYVDFMRPINSIDRIQLSWWRFQKSLSGVGGAAYPTAYSIVNGGAPGTVGGPEDNAFVALTFFCRNRRPT